LEPVVDRAAGTLHFDKEGNVLWFQGSGHILYRYTNDDTGKSVDLNISGPGKQTEGADGLLHVDGTGPWALLLGPTDNPSSTALYIHGHLDITRDPSDGTLTLVSYTGTAEDICDMLE